MAENSGISWTDHTFNPWMGCTKVSPACKNCYAERDMDHRYGKVAWGPSGTRVLTSDANWMKPVYWNKNAAIRGTRTRVFCASLADVFEDWDGTFLTHKGDNVLVCDNCGELANDGDLHGSCKCGRFLQRVDWAGMNDVRKRLIHLIDETPNLDWLLLTKRPENIRKMWNDIDPRPAGLVQQYRENVWLGTSVENQKYADLRIPELLKCRDLSPVLFLSCEPLLGDVNLSMVASNAPFQGLDSLTGLEFDYVAQETRNHPKVDWVIAGGESGPDARPSHPDWFRLLRDQCHSANVPFHFKQWGEWLPIDQAERIHDGSIESSVWRDKPSKDDLPILTLRVGGKKAGRLLDGVLHDAFPEVQHAT
jgi:protein gp37